MNEDTFVLTILNDKDYLPPDVHGPFDSMKEAQTYAENLRRQYELPWIEATPENNEAWSEAGWYFGIVPLKWEVASE